MTEKIGCIGHDGDCCKTREQDYFELAQLRKEIVSLLYALKSADSFITNGIALGFIRMPDDGVKDPAKLVPGIIKAAIYSAIGETQ